MMDCTSRRGLVEGVHDAYALDGNVLPVLDPFALTTAGENLREMFYAHGESRRQQEKLRKCLEALKGFGLASLHKDVAATACAQTKGVFDVFRGDEPIGEARDAFWTEHFKIASYEILERVAERAGDGETVRAACENRAEEWAMAGRIAEVWDRFVDLVLSGRGRRT